MLINPLALIGAGGHAAVVGDAALLAGISALTFYSQNPREVGQTLLEYAIEMLSPDMQLRNFHVAIGCNSTRARLYRQLLDGGNVPVTIAHPGATVSISAEIHDGSFIAAGAIVGPRSRVGSAVIVNHHAIVDHDASVGDYSHIAPGVILGGGVRVGKKVLVGAGATVLPSLTVGDSAVIGAGAVVLHDVLPGQTVVGVPARKV